LLEDPIKQLPGIIKNVDRHRKPTLFLTTPDNYSKTISAKMEAFSNGKSVDNATDFYSLSEGGVLFVIGVTKLKKTSFRNEAAFFDTLLFLKRHRGLLQLLGNRI
jgi:hypothetical protein